MAVWGPGQGQATVVKEAGANVMAARMTVEQQETRKANASPNHAAQVREQQQKQQQQQQQCRVPALVRILSRHQRDLQHSLHRRKSDSAKGPQPPPLALLRQQLMAMQRLARMAELGQG